MDAKQYGVTNRAYYQKLADLVREKKGEVVEEKTASGAIASFDDGTGLPVKSLVVNIEPVQEGEGDPSPENVRPIKGWTGVTIKRYGADESDNLETVTVDFGDAGTVYGGTLDVTTGTLTVTRATLDMGILNLGYATQAGYFYSSDAELNVRKPGFDNLICSEYKINPNVRRAVELTNLEIMGSSDTNIFFKDSDYTDIAAMKEALAGVILCYERANPVTYQLTPQQVTTLLGTNNITADTGDVSVTYDANRYAPAELETELRGIINSTPAKHYIAVWDKANAQMTRAGDAADIPTTTTNFTYNGSVNANYDNPFDTIYPWSGRRLCNIDVPKYMELGSSDSLRDCVTAWEGDEAFSYDDQYGVWVYTPEFWGDSWDNGDNRYFEVCDRYVQGKVYYRERIEGRWHGRAVTLTVNGTDKTCLIPSVGMPAKRIAMSTLHTYAKNYSATLDNIYSIDASTLLYLVEFASFNSQVKLGSGVSDLYQQNATDTIQEAATDSTVVKVLAANAAKVIVGAIFDIGTSNGGVEVGSFYVTAREADSEDSTILNVTLDRAVTVTTAHIWSVHGHINTADAEIGSKSGYIGTNGRSIAYYRGEEFHANLWRYILGTYHQATTNKLYIANSEAEADNYDAINANVHKDTGIVLAATEGYVNALGMARAEGLCAVVACIAVGGNSTNPVGDYHYIDTTTNTVLLLGGLANYGTSDGRFCGRWSSPASGSSWRYAARPVLMPPGGGA